MDALADSPAARFQRAFWLLPAGFALHELEEWRILDWYGRYWTGLVPSQMRPEVVHAFLLVAIFAYAAWARMATRFRSARTSAHLLLIPFILIIYGHAFFHVGWALIYGAYDPGGFTALFVLPPLALYFTHRAVREGFMARGVAIGLLAIAPLFGIAGLLGGNVAPPGGLPHLRLAARVLDLLD
jgi:Protein of unknown function with HXXEE motif